LYQTLHYHEVREISAAISNARLVGFLPLLFLVALIPVNWGLESLKWYYLACTASPINYKKAMAGVLSGVSISLFFPFRTGEFVGRVFSLPPDKRAEGIFISMAGSLSQLLITILAGTLAFFSAVYLDGFCLFCEYVAVEIEWIFPLLISLIAIFIYFWSPAAGKFLLKRKLPWKLTRSAEALAKLGNSLLTKLALISLVRYGVFILQFYLALLFFGVDPGIYTVMICAALTFATMAVIPSFTLAEIGLRGPVAVFFFSFYTDASSSIVMASVVLWLCNIGIPALAGIPVIARFKTRP
jgi:hypothetical protein